MPRTKQTRDIWHFRQNLPIQDEKNIVSLDENSGPLQEFSLNGNTILAKPDHLLPTGSFKDRGASVLVSKLKELGIRRVVEDSSGNAGVSLAAYCQAADIKCNVFVPDNTAPGKIDQLQHYEARITKVPGPRENAAREALQAASSTFYASHVWNPYYFQGTKTFIYEVLEELSWESPDTLILPVGNGTLILGASIGLAELSAHGVIRKIPRIVAVQAENCSPLAACSRNSEFNIDAFTPGTTVAAGIAVARPLRARQIIDAVVSSKGFFLTVSDSEILLAQQFMIEEKCDLELTAAATIAGVSKYTQTCPNKETIVTIISGHGAKER